MRNRQRQHERELPNPGSANRRPVGNVLLAHQRTGGPRTGASCRSRWSSRRSSALAALGGRHHLYSDDDEDAASGSGAGRPQPARGGLGDGDAPARHAGSGRPGDGARTPAAPSGDPLLRPGVSIHLPRVRAPLSGRRGAARDGFRRGLLRQRHGRVLLRHLGMRVARPYPLLRPEGCPRGGLRVHRGLVQPPAPTLRPRPPVARKLRRTTPGAGRNRRFGHSYWSDIPGQAQDGHRGRPPDWADWEPGRRTGWGARGVSSGSAGTGEAPRARPARPGGIFRVPARSASGSGSGPRKGPPNRRPAHCHAPDRTRSPPCTGHSGTWASMRPRRFLAPCRTDTACSSS